MERMALRGARRREGLYKADRGLRGVLGAWRSSDLCESVFRLNVDVSHCLNLMLDVSQ
jgi:hypothetical protein